MSCISATLAGLAQDCEGSLGGIKRAWIAPYVEGTGTVSGGTVSLSGTTGFKAYYFKKNTANMTSTLNVDSANGTNYVSTDLVLTFSKMETKKRTEVAAMSLDDMMVVVQDANNKYWFLGLDNPVTNTAGTGQTGTAKSDGNNYQITLNDESESYPYELDSASVEAIKAIDFPT